MLWLGCQAWDDLPDRELVTPVDLERCARGRRQVDLSTRVRRNADEPHYLTMKIIDN
jgi:hypothetical protein